MGIINIIQNIKQIHKEDIIFVHIGKFYYSYGKDAYIISYLFQYKLMQIDEIHTYSCAFPEQAFSKVIAHLENHKINYLVVDKRNNYDVEEISNNHNLNTYQKYFEKAKEYINMKKRIDKISDYLIKHITEIDIKEKIGKMEAIINETRKV